jgi:two-component system chemotaxis response regulator CheB
MPPLFTRLLAERLHATCQLKVEEASEGALVEVGKILVAPGDFHMKIRQTNGGVKVHLDQEAPENSCRPAVDTLFRSVGEVYGGSVIAAILTGMGQDGLRGVELLKAQGASVLAQDEETSVVWGMPGAVVNAKLADRVLPLDQIVPEILALTGRAKEEQKKCQSERPTRKLPSITTDSCSGTSIPSLELCWKTTSTICLKAGWRRSSGNTGSPQLMTSAP